MYHILAENAPPLVMEYYGIYHKGVNEVRGHTGMALVITSYQR